LIFGLYNLGLKIYWHLKRPERGILNTEIVQAIELLSERAEKLSVRFSDRQSDKLARFLEHLEQYNQHTNLVSNAAPKVVALEHLLDSMSLIESVSHQIEKRKKGASRLIDIGSGAGFPGLILAIMFADLDVTLMDSIEKKTRFLEATADLLDLQNVSVLTERAESIAHHPQYRETFDIATARAVGGSGMIVELALPLLNLGGVLILQKTESQLVDESHKARKAAKLLGGVMGSVVALDQTILGKARSLILVTKEEHTADKYPRAWKKIKEHPLGQ
jgi:16S rRNA (guanine527-N7)-methyltransferase